ncbi:pap 25a associated domain family [Botrytis cinerea]
MEGQPSTGNSKYQYQSAQWSRLVRRNTHADLNSSSSPSIPGFPQLPTQFIPILLPQQPLFHQQQLEQYNKLISSGGNTRLQTAPLPPLLSAQHIQAVPGQRSSSSGVTPERKPKPAARGVAQHQNSTLSRESNSVPSTPHQHPRKFSFGESREPSPNAPGSHSPRSAYSESNITLPSRPPPAPRRGCQYETAMASIRRRMPYSLGADRLEQLNDSDVKSKLSDEEERKLSTDMRELYDGLLPTAETDERRRRLVSKLEDMFNKEWPGHDIRVYVFGSSGNLLCTDASDVDICITTDWKVMEGVCMIAELLAKNGMQKVICVSTAKVPIVKIFDPELKLLCDMNVNNTQALENTRMIKTYIEIDPRVRPLAMIIKHWTKSRAINDAVGGTLSSYTWICMIINFLQSREPPVLPSLHQRPHLKLPTKEGGESSFADDIDALRGFGQKNKSTLGELLFQFFRFYGHEFDYDKQVVSVRMGRQISKEEKKWAIATNNMLCVEEPFNTERNLGNTADDFSFRGLHLEMRRAFELISDGKLDECCEEYIFPKEQERVWEKPPPSKKPTLTASHPPHRNGRGGHRGGRNNHSNRNSSNGSRKSSNSNYDNHMYPQHGIPSNISTQEQWAAQQQAQSQLHNHLYATYSVLQAQENTLRMQLVQQTYMEQAHAQAQAQAQAYAQSHGRIQGGGMPIKQQATDRNRTSSFDQGPLTAPIRPDGMYFYPLQYNGQPMYAYPTSNTNPSSPQLSAAVPELRRGIHRSTVTNGSSSNMAQSNGSIRSHSQPGTRTAPSPLLLQGNGHPAHGTNGLGRTATTPPELSTPKEYVGYYVNEPTHTYTRRDLPLAIPSFGDMSGNRRRLSTDQLPQSIRDRIKRNPSRSPSPLGNDRRFSLAQSSPGQHTMSSSNLRNLNTHGPLVVNGSSAAPGPNSIPINEGPVFENKISHGRGSVGSISQASLTESDISLGEDLSGQRTPKFTRSGLSEVSPLVANGSKGLDGFSRLSPNSRNMLARNVPNGGIPLLNIASGHNETPSNEFSHLSPVYETHTPSPTINKKLENLKLNGPAVIEKNKIDHSRPIPKQSVGIEQPVKQFPSNLKQNGHTRSAKSEGGGPGVSSGKWQQTQRKKGRAPAEAKNANGGHSHGEKLPVNESERKGG